MALNWHIAGHQNKIEFLSNIVNSGKIGHAYIFAGPDEVGKKTVATNFAKILVCERSSACNECVQCRSFDGGVNADFIKIDQAQTIKIEQLRNISFALNLKPYAAKYKVALINNADNMTTEAANSLLKVLEEPKPYTILLFVTANPYKILPTILSRAQKINFGLVARNLYDHLLPQTLTSEQRQLVHEYSSGRPGLALTLANNPELLEEIKQLNQQIGLYLGADLADRLVLAARLADMESEDIRKGLKFWLSELEQKILFSPSQELAKKIIAVSGAVRHLDSNLNSKLALSNMMIKS